MWRCHPFYKILVWAQQENRSGRLKIGGGCEEGIEEKAFFPFLRESGAELRSEEE